jgi:hypothetical protein
MQVEFASDVWYDNMQTKGFLEVRPIVMHVYNVLFFFLFFVFSS